MGMQDVTQGVKEFVADALGNIHTALPGKVEKYHPDRGEADIYPCGKCWRPDGAAVDYPLLANVPIFFPQCASGTASISMPVKKGDGCLLVFAEQPLDTWRTGAAPAARLSFDLGNAVAVIGLFARAGHAAAEAASRDAIIIDRNGTRIALLPNNTVEISGDVKVNGSLNVTGTITGRW